MIEQSPQAKWKAKFLKTPKGRATIAWYSIIQRLRHRKSYATIELQMTREEFLVWAVPAYGRWMRRNPTEVPTLDRKDGEDHYRIGNLRLCTKADNARRTSRSRNLVAPAGKAWCSAKCKRYLPISRFNKNRRNSNGLAGACRQCAAEATKRSEDKWRR